MTHEYECMTVRRCDTHTHTHTVCRASVNLSITTGAFVVESRVGQKALLLIARCSAVCTSGLLMFCEGVVFAVHHGSCWLSSSLGDFSLALLRWQCVHNAVCVFQYLCLQCLDCCLDCPELLHVS